MFTPERSESGKNSSETVWCSSERQQRRLDEFWDCSKWERVINLAFVKRYQMLPNHSTTAGLPSTRPKKNESCFVKRDHNIFLARRFRSTNTLKKGVD